MAINIQQEFDQEDEIDEALAVIVKALKSYSLETRKRATVRYLKAISAEIDHVANGGARKELRNSDGGETPELPFALKPSDKFNIIQKADKDLLDYERVYKILATNPGITIDDLATRMYGKTNDTMNQRARQHLNKLRNKGMAKSDGNGFWEAIQ